MLAGPVVVVPQVAAKSREPSSKRTEHYSSAAKLNTAVNGLYALRKMQKLTMPRASQMDPTCSYNFTIREVR